MLETIFQTIPRGLFIPSLIVMLLGMALAWQRNVRKGNPFFWPVFFFIILAVGWRVAAMIYSSRYAAVLLIPTVIFGAYFFRYIGEFAARFRFLSGRQSALLVSVAVIALVTICIGKTFRFSRNDYEILKVCDALRRSVSAEPPGREVWIKSYSSHDSKRLIYYSGLSAELFHMHITQDDPERYAEDISADFKKQLFRNQTSTKSMYFIFTGKEAQMPEQNALSRWEKEAVRTLYRSPGKSSRKMLLLHYVPPFAPKSVPADEVIIPSKNEENILRNGNFEEMVAGGSKYQALRKLAPDLYSDPAGQFPRGWNIDLPSGLTAAEVPLLSAVAAPEAIAGAYSLRLTSRKERSIAMYDQNFFPFGTYDFRALVRGDGPMEVQLQLLVYNAQGKYTHTVSLPAHRLETAGLYRIHQQFEIKEADDAQKVLLALPPPQAGSAVWDEIELVPYREKNQE